MNDEIIEQMRNMIRHFETLVERHETRTHRDVQLFIEEYKPFIILNGLSYSTLQEMSVPEQMMGVSIVTCVCKRIVDMSEDECGND